MTSSGDSAVRCLIDSNASFTLNACIEVPHRRIGRVWHTHLEETIKC